MTEHHCRHVANDQPRMLRTHQPTCDHTDCAGCVPCPEGHCSVCDREHVTADGRGTDLTCATCIGDTRTNLHQIVTLSARLLGEAIIRGINSQAAVLAGPAADPEAWGYRRMSALAQRIDPAWLDDCRDEAHPSWVLGTWDLLVRQHLDQHTDTRATLTETATYLDCHLTGLAHDPDFAFDELAAAFRACRLHLEDVLRDGERDERGAPCPACGAARLVKSYGDADTDDRWACPRCHQQWTEHDYRAKVAATYVDVAEHLTATDMQRRTRVPAGTVRSWATRGKLKLVGRDSNGRALYRVTDVEALRDAPTTEQRSAS